jgi:hypothetical protein
MSEKSQTITLPFSSEDCYELVKRLGNDKGLKEKRSDKRGILWSAKNFILVTRLTPISENKTQVEIIASSGSLFDGGALEKHVRIFAAQLKKRSNFARPVKIETPLSATLVPAKSPDIIEATVIPDTKKCPYCAEIIRYEAIVCRHCGRDLPPTSTSAIEAEKQNIELRKPKSPTIAVLLNAFPLILGLGSIYIGKWNRFFVIIVLQLFSLLPMTMLGLREYNAYLLALIWIASMIDIHSQAKIYNEQITA